MVLETEIVLSANFFDDVACGRQRRVLEVDYRSDGALQRAGGILFVSFRNRAPPGDLLEWATLDIFNRAR